VAVTEDCYGWADQIIVLDDGSRLIVESDYDGSTTTLLTAEQWIDRCHEYAIRENWQRFPDEYPYKKTGADWTKLSAALKEVWTEQGLTSQLYNETPFLGGLTPDNPSRVGEYAVIPIKRDEPQNDEAPRP